MTREEAIEIIKEMQTDNFNHEPEEIIEALDMAIKALEQEPCDDAISRQAMHIELEKWITYGEYKYSNATKYLYDRIDRLPSVTPKPKTDVLDKIRTEIIENSIEDYKYHGCGTDELIIETSEVLNILDKYKAESEDKE